MQELHLQSFYRGERISHLAFIGFGISCILVAFIYKYYAKNLLSDGFFTTTLLLGCVQAFLGFYRFSRTFKNYKLANESHQANTQYLSTSEFENIQHKIKRFQSKRTLISIVLGLGIIVMGVLTFLDFDKYILGTIAAVILQAGGMLSFDLFSQYRAQEYLQQLAKTKEDYQSPWV